MNEPIESTYFNWLCAKVMQIENPTPSLTYWNLLRELHNTEFVWLLSGDDNRAEDGLDLRPEFLTASFLKRDSFWENVGCSVLEMLIALARRAEFETDIPAKDWFWTFIDNLGLLDFNDASDENPEIIKEILFRFIWRTYEYNGVGGLFPLRNPEHDQRKVEIWYQFAEYLTDQERD